ncbi:histidine acid phosphatase, putative [Aspergillus fumigatus A1163]|uniref:Histidine acid phosphatase, putative n=1 Tax=Aspergillus fumigatus (strain CBS 144.89 / FGSC A1163 / CEA10) TaxID=451804 RepID=B0YAH6_ASPFC|nr:histidine acid phosphatase, putative [Aspergillus fumigatus A1163]
MFGINIHDKYPDFQTPKNVWTATSERTVKTAQGFILGYTGNETAQIKLTQVGGVQARRSRLVNPVQKLPGIQLQLWLQTVQCTYSPSPPLTARANNPRNSSPTTPNLSLRVSKPRPPPSTSRPTTSSPCSSSAAMRPSSAAPPPSAPSASSPPLNSSPSSYGRDLSPAIGFPWLNATRTILADDSASQDLYVSFTHRELPPTVLTALGLFNNSAYSGANDVNATMPTDAINYGRAWKSSQILPFLTNIAIEKMVCDSYGYDDGVYYRVLVNEGPQPLVGCRDGPGESCSEEAFGRFVQQRGEWYGDFGKACGVDYENSTDVLSIYQ